MHAWPGDDEEAMAPSVRPHCRSASAKSTSLPLKNGNDLRESGYLVAVGSRNARFRRKHKSKATVLMFVIVLLTLLSLSVVITALYVTHKRPRPWPLCETKECLRSAAGLALSMDNTAHPCDDFYQFVCGNWAGEHPRPHADRSYDWFRDKQSAVYLAVRDLLDRDFDREPRAVRLARDMYRACLHTDAMDKRGVRPVIDILAVLGLPAYPTYLNISARVDDSTFSFDWLAVVINIKIYLGMDVLIGFDLFTDPKNSSVYRLVMGSPETTNPFPSMQHEKKRHTDRRDVRYPATQHKNTATCDSTYNTHATSSEPVDSSGDDDENTRQVYTLFYAELIKLLVLDSGVLKADNLTESEVDHNILQAATDYLTLNNIFSELESNNETQQEDQLSSTIPEYTVDEIQTHTDSVVETNSNTAVPIWKRYLEGVFSISNVQLNFEKDKILVSDQDLKYMSLMASVIASTPPISIELFIWIKVSEVMAVHTTFELRLLFERASGALRGARADRTTPPRSLYCARAVTDMMGMAVSYGIADPYFLNVTKPKIQIMLNEMKNALARLVGNAKWMDDDTKLATYNKITQMKTLIGFPDWLLEEGKLDEYYHGVEIDVGKHLENMISIIQVKTKTILNKYRDASNYSWATDPTEVNAYHTFQENTITVPLVMLQYPFYDLGLDSLNYGSLGTVIGHEITHGFDNFGRQFDKNGNLLPWWSNETVEAFINMTECFVEQYSSFYIPELSKHVDGKKTLGENIADNGGVREAFAALQEHLHKTGPEPKLPGFEHITSEQLFFLSYGNLWCGASTTDSLKADLDDEHSPQQFRARGALQNFAEFAEAWRCPSPSPMNPTHRCIIF